ncbi:MauE/DoxX family redox-associated membrane protein [Actinomadura macrotermitis]|uniref:Methylamine utilisation protein MauE domain-containing protein n=1 Tax=Actinomadura macrotermitis TaxID=2585200 RepID=A0A7K0BTP2_9ACTN|nr:MauE/DoxX family redox-associated membrane protein [Actinomadura macrotermitis]MQY04563.1 hypothetical protein [Actinomadura macrotermitis]
MQYVALAARCTLELVFLVAVIGKARSPKAFREFRASVPGLAPGLPPAAVSAAVPAAEAAIVVLAAIGPTAPAGLALAGAVLLMFTAAIVRTLRAGRQATCRCLGGGPAPLGRVQVVRNLALAVVAAAGLSAQLTATAPVHPGGAVVAVAAAGVLGAVFVFFAELADLLIVPSPR